MKKIIFTLVCAMISLTMVAQPGGQRGDRRNMRMGGSWVNMEAIKSVGLDSVQVKAVQELKEKKDQQFKEMMKSGDKEQREAMMEKMKSFREECQNELKALIGEEKYNQYQEKRQSMRGGQQMGRPDRPQRRGDRPQPKEAE